jgi:hypothetical protein
LFLIMHMIIDDRTKQACCLLTACPSARCVYDGKADYLAMSQQQPKKSSRAAGGALAVQEPTRVLTRRTRSQRDPAAEGGFVSLVRPIWCLDPNGSPVQMQQQDIALMTYEQLRKELSASDK